MTNANNTHTSLETAKLLKDCGIESDNIFCKGTNINISLVSDNDFKITKKGIKNNGSWTYEIYPAFTWQEILWEYSEDFLSVVYERDKSKQILFLLQEKKYDEADLYFRENCILIKK